MHEDTPTPKVVLLLGAGFACATGLPVMSGFGRVFRERMGRLIRDDKPVAQMLRQAGRTFRLFQRYCARAGVCVEVNRNNMEEVFCVAESLRESGCPAIRLPDGTTYPVAQIIEHIQLWLWNIYQNPHRLFDYGTRDAVMACYRRFVNRVGHLGANLGVLTTNYDVAFEYVAWEQGFPCVYPWPARSLWVHRPGSFTGEPGRAPVVCKLHGSVNFLEGPAPQGGAERHALDPPGSMFGVCTEVAHAGDVYGGSRIVRGGTHGGRWVSRAPYPAIIALGTINAIQEKYGRGLVPAIIPPTYAKLGEKPWLRETWAAARVALSRARLIVIVGYSMPASDGFMRAMIQAAMAERDRRNALRVLVVDKAAETNLPYRQFFAPLCRSNRLLMRTGCSFEEWAATDDAQFGEWLDVAAQA